MCDNQQKIGLNLSLQKIKRDIIVNIDILEANIGGHNGITCTSLVAIGKSLDEATVAISGYKKILWCMEEEMKDFFDFSMILSDILKTQENSPDGFCSIFDVKMARSNIESLRSSLLSSVRKGVKTTKEERRNKKKGKNAEKPVVQITQESHGLVDDDDWVGYRAKKSKDANDQVQYLKKIGALVE